MDSTLWSIDRRSVRESRFYIQTITATSPLDISYLEYIFLSHDPGWPTCADRFLHHCQTYRSLFLDIINRYLDSSLHFIPHPALNASPVPHRGASTRLAIRALFDSLRIADWDRVWHRPRLNHGSDKQRAAALSRSI